MKLNELLQVTYGNTNIKILQNFATIYNGRVYDIPLGMYKCYGKAEIDNIVSHGTNFQVHITE